jgi:hypothetical protein
MGASVPFMGTPADLRKAARSLRSHAEQLESGGIKWVDYTPWDCWTGSALLVNVYGRLQEVAPPSARSDTMLAMHRAILAMRAGVAPNYRLPTKLLGGLPLFITRWNDEQISAEPVIAMLRLAADILDGWVDQLAALDTAAGARPRITAKGV